MRAYGTFCGSVLPDHAVLPTTTLVARWLSSYEALRAHVNRTREAYRRLEQARAAMASARPAHDGGFASDAWIEAHERVGEAEDLYSTLLYDKVAHEAEQQAWQTLDAQRGRGAPPHENSPGTCPGCGEAHPTHQGHEGTPVVVDGNTCHLQPED